MQYEEKKVNITGIAGIFTTPITDNPVPAALLLHGFGSHKDEVGNLYMTLAHTLAEQRIASLRIDFSGWGESEGDMADTTIAGQVADAERATQYLAASQIVDPSRLGIVGFSLGSAITMILAADHPDVFKSMVLLSPVGHLRDDFLGSLGQENFDRAAQEGIVTIDLGWRSVTLKQGFFESLAAYDLHQKIRVYPGALSLLAGSEDFSAPSARLLAEVSSAKDKQLIILDGADHIFNVLERDDFANEVVNAIAAWLAAWL